METIGKCTRLAAVLVGLAALMLVGLAVQAGAQGIADLTVCNGVEVCDPALTEVCKAGFVVSLTDFTHAANTNSGAATYTYQICVPPLGVCTGTVRLGEQCKDNNFCKKQGQNEDPNATYNRTCAVNDFKALSNFDVTFPDFGTCVSRHNEITGTCSVGTFGLGDASCFIKTCGGVRGGTQCANSTECQGNPDGETCNAASTFVAKCDGQSAENPGDCLTMTVTIAGETTGLGLGAAVVADKEGQTCSSACIQGPSCTPCEPPGDGEACLTRTIGFWGTHPWITNNYDPVTVCGNTLDCNITNTGGMSDPSCQVGVQGSIMEGLGSIPSECGKNQPYVAMVKQLTAAYLNLNATAALTSNAGRCSSFTYNNMTISQWITACESLCGADKATISSSGCIEALDAFNNSTDSFAQTPAPFDRPSVDNAGNVSGADPSAFTAAQGPPKLVIGKTAGRQCQ